MREKIQKMKKIKKTKETKTKDTSILTDRGNEYCFTKTTLVLASTPITNGFTYEKTLPMLKDEIQK